MSLRRASASRRLAVAIGAAAVGTFAFASPAAARGDDRPRDEGRASTEAADAWKPAFVGELRTGAYVRSNDGYFDESKVFGWPVSGTAAGIRLDLGAELLPRLSLVASGSYWGDGAQRRYARLMVTSESLLVLARYAFARMSSDGVVADLSSVVGGGHYWIRETYADPTLFANTYVHDGGSLGFVAGLDAAVAFYGVRMVVGYAYHYAPASISNALGASVRAGGHEISFGVGARI